MNKPICGIDWRISTGARLSEWAAEQGLSLGRHLESRREHSGEDASPIREREH